jgi:hypothetical protein
MEEKKYTILGLFGVMLALVLSGCATTDQPHWWTSDQQYWWGQHESQRAGREAYPYMPASGEAAKPMVMERAELLPPNAKPGECYARVLVPPRYKTETVRVLTREASERVETIPARYEEVEERVLIREASKRFEEVPAEYGWAEEKVVVEEAHTVWQKGRGLIEKVDNATGEIMCLVEVPASYKTVRKQVVVKPATVREVQIPAEYQTVKVTKMVSPPQEKRTAIPAEYETVSRTQKTSDGYMEWKRVLCETNITSDTVSKIQDALIKAGHDPGPVDGMLGPQTQSAIRSYQKSKGLAEGDLTYETIESLGVMVN